MNDQLWLARKASGTPIVRCGCQTSRPVTLGATVPWRAPLSELAEAAE